MTAPFADFGMGYQAPRLTVRRVAGRLDSGEMLLRRWAGCWIDFIALGLVWLGPSFVLPKSMDWSIWVGNLAALAYFPITEGLWAAPWASWSPEPWW